MSAQLYPGIKAVHLVLTRPYDTVRLTDIRDDLLGVKVWFSTTSGFDPNLGQGTLYSEANSLLTTITGLDEDKTYYVKYAFISKIDPTTYTVSSQLTAKTLAAGVHVYGYLTNDPVGISTSSTGVISVTVSGSAVTNPTVQQQATAWQQASAGVFKVYNDNQDVTGANDSTLGPGNPGPVYSIKTDSYLGGLSSANVVINATTGAYYATGMTTGYDNGSVTFQAVYNGVTIERVWSVYRGKAGQLAPIITLTTNVKEFIYKDVNATTSQTTSSTITATLTNLTAQPVFTTQAFTRAGVALGTGAIQVGFTQDGNSITITDTQFSALGITLGYVIVTATIGTVFDSLTLYRLNDGTDQITVEQSNPSHTISAAANGDTVLANYVGSGNTITVKKGITTLNVDNDSPYTVNTWRVSNITAVNITCDPSPEVFASSIRYDPMSAMSADDAYIDYTITVQTTATTTQDFVVRQSFAKSKQGIQGSTARTVNITAPRQAFVTLKNTTTPIPTTITLTATQSNFVNPVYTWLVDLQAPGTLGTASGNTFILNSFASGTAKSVKVTVTEPTSTNTAFDEFSVYSLKEGDDGIAAGLSNENQTISCDSSGVVKSGQFPFNTTLQVVQGINFLNGTTTPAAVFGPSGNVGTGMTSTINASTGVVTVTGISSEFASATYTVTIGSLIIYKTLTLNKSIEGSDAPVVNLTTTAQVFVTAKNSTTVSPSISTFTASVYNLGASPQIVWKVDGVAQAAYNNSVTFPLSNFSTGTKVVRVEATANSVTVFDQITVYALKEGDDGIAAGLINENQTVTCNSKGQVVGTVSLTSKFVAIRGTTELAYPAVEFEKVTENGLTASINQQTGVISVTAITAANSTIAMSATFRAKVGNVAIDRILTVNKSLNGAKGNSTQVEYSTTDTGPWSTVAMAEPKYMRLNSIDEDNTVISLGSATLIKGADAKTLALNADSYIFNADASNAISGFITLKASKQNTTNTVTWTTSPSVTLYTASTGGTTTTTGDIVYLRAADYADNTKVVITATISADSLSDTTTIARISAGSNAATVVFSNPNHPLPSDSLGTVSTYTSSGTTLQVYQAGVARTITAITATGSGITAGTISGLNTTTATIGVHNSITADSATVKYDITYTNQAGISSTTSDTQTIYKAKAGTNGTSPVVIDLSNDSHTIPTLFNGTGANFTGASTTATIYVGTTDDTANWNFTTAVSNVTISGTNTRAVTVTGISDDAGYVDFSATRSGFPTQTARFSLARAKSGADGTPAKVYRVTSSVGSIVKGTTGAYTPSSITFSATSTTGNGSPVAYSGRFIFYTSTDGTTYSAVLSSSFDQSSLSYSIPANIKYVRAELYLAGFAALVDTETIPIIADGTKGDKGDDGSSIKGDSGPQGIVSRIAYQLVLQTSGVPSYSTSTYGAGSLPGGSWSPTAPTATVGNVVWYSYGRYNPNNFTHESISALTTEWSTPIAASVFQDIKSDNWNGGTPSGGSFSGATAGYYISKTEGSLYGSAIYLRGNSEVDVAGRLIVRGNNIGSTTVPTFAINNQTWTTATANFGYVSENSTYSAGSGNTNIIRAAVTGYSYNQSTSTLNVGVLGIGDASTDNAGVGNSIGVVGVGRLAGGWFEAKGTNGAGIYSRAAGSTTRSAVLTGTVEITGAVNIIGYDLTVTGNISATGNVTAYSASDKRLKTNIIKIQNPLEKLRALGGYTYDWTPDYLAKFTKEIGLGLMKPHDVGVIAQEVLAQLPEAVNIRKDGTLAVNYEKLVPLLIEAILELDRKLK